MRKKSQELLDNLNKIVKKPKGKWEQRQVLSDCNKMWKSIIDSGINSLPKSYNEDKWIEAPDDEDGDVYKWCDRVYGGLYSQDLLQKDGTTYKGKLYKKRRLMQGADGKNFYSQCTVTADGRWFDNGGIPIIPPKEVEIEKKEEEEEKYISGEMWSSESKEKEEKKELDMLKNLK